MKAITIKQPWASLIIEGIKDIENRTWPTKFRGRVLIHAGMDKTLMNVIPSSFLSVDQIDLIKNVKFSPKEWDLYGVIIGSVEIVDCVVNHESIWAEKSLDCNDCPDVGACCDGKCPHIIYNWVLANPIKFPEPIPAKGKLSFWEYNGELPII